MLVGDSTLTEGGHQNKQRTAHDGKGMSRGHKAMHECAVKAQRGWLDITELLPIVSVCVRETGSNEEVTAGLTSGCGIACCP